MAITTLKRIRINGSWIRGGYTEGASYTTTLGSNKDLTFTAVDPEVDDATIRYVVSGNSTALSVSVSGNAVTVNVATDSGGAATSTAQDVLAAVNGSTPASAILTASLANGSDGTGVVSALAAQTLVGGRVATVGRGRPGWPIKRARSSSGRIF